MFVAAYFLFVYETRKWAPLVYRCNPVGIHRRVGVNSRVMLASMPQHLSLTHTAMAVAIAARPFSSSVLTLTRPRPKWVTLNPVASYSPQPTSSSSAAVSRKLILYSKPGCCLCDGLKEKLHAAFALSSLDSLHDVVLQVSTSSFDIIYKPNPIQSNPTKTNLN